MFQQHQIEEGLKASSLHTAQKTFPAATPRKPGERAATSPIEVRTRPLQARNYRASAAGSREKKRLLLTVIRLHSKNESK